MRAHEFMAGFAAWRTRRVWSWTNSSSTGITWGRIPGKQSGSVRLDGVDTSERPTRRQSLPDASAYCVYLTRMERKTADHSYLFDFINFFCNACQENACQRQCGTGRPVHNHRCRPAETWTMRKGAYILKNILDNCPGISVFSTV